MTLRLLILLALLGLTGGNILLLNKSTSLATETRQRIETYNKRMKDGMRACYWSGEHAMQIQDAVGETSGLVLDNDQKKSVFDALDEIAKARTACAVDDPVMIPVPAPAKDY